MRKRLRHLPPSLIGAAVTGLVCALAGFLAAGSPGLLGALAGCALAAGSFTLSSVAVAWADSVNPRLVLVVGLATYAVKMIVLGASLYGLSTSQWEGLPAMAASIAATVVVWVAVQAVWVYRSRIPYVDLTVSRTGADS